MTIAKLTKRTVDATNPGPKERLVWDEELKGFGLKVTPKGRKVYLVQYRLGGRKGRTRRITVGRHGTITPDEARAEAKRLLGEVSAGRDPADQRDEQRAGRALGEAMEQFLTEHVEAKLKPTSAREYRRLAELHIIPEFVNRRLDDIQRSDVARLHYELRDKPYQANRVLAVLSKFFNWCEGHGIRANASNPCRHVERFKERQRERFLSATELARLGEALTAAEVDQSASPWVVAAIRLLILTGARLSEILKVTWGEVDIEHHQLRLVDSKTGHRKSIYLNAPALEVIASVPRLDDNPYVICGEKPGTHLVNLRKPWVRIRRAAGLEDVRLHDLRHSFASVAAGGGMSLPVIGALLGHSQPQTTQRYAHLGADPLKEASDVVGRRIADAMNPGPISDTVVPMKSPSGVRGGQGDP